MDKLKNKDKIIKITMNNKGNESPTNILCSIRKYEVSDL